jgi:hypothetical protein
MLYSDAVVVFAVAVIPVMVIKSWLFALNTDTVSVSNTLFVFNTSPPNISVVKWI